jgi:2-oxoglutarate ferredoxin oxidoreductase subunit alpha
MPQQIAWKIGGQQGEGIESGGELLAAGLAAYGFHLYGYRVFSSRIRGGHTNYNLRIGTDRVASIADRIDLLVALDQETIAICGDELGNDGVILADEHFGPLLPATGNGLMIAAPLTALAAQAGNSVVKNVVAVGITTALLNIDPSAWGAALTWQLADKGEPILRANRLAFQAGRDYAAANLQELAARFAMEAPKGPRLRYLTGNEAISRGAIAAGVHLMSAYPITPASEIMEAMVKELPKRGGVMIQTEDEISACMMAIGANYAGTRAFTATSGPGLSLMAESIGLAGMTETPLVVVDVQRGGPSTGLPTKHEQSDLMAAVFSTHGEAPKIVMAPDSIGSAQQDTVTAFNLSEQYQCPVILLSDMQLSLGKQTVDDREPQPVDVQRGKLLLTDDLPELAKNQYFKRYQNTADGLSPRVLPGTKNGIHHVTGLEHDETGRPLEAVANRTAQMDKRLRKLSTVVERFPVPIRMDAPFAKPQLLVLSMGGADGAVSEAVERLRRDGVEVNLAQIRLLHPFPAEILQPLLTEAQRLVVVEHNATGQLAWLIRANCGQCAEIHSVLKYDGNPFRPSEVVAGCREVL